MDNLIPSLIDLVFLHLKEKYPYWKFRVGEVNEKALLDERGWTIALIEADEVIMVWSPYEHHKTVKAAVPDFLEQLDEHVMQHKWQVIWKEGDFLDSSILVR